MTASDIDTKVRLAAFAFLDGLIALHGEMLPRSLLQQGFVFEGVRVPLMAPQGIFRPAILREVPLTITTVPEVEDSPRPYEDEFGVDGFIKYKYRGTNPNHSDNVGLRRAWERQVPLIYLFGVEPGLYRAIYPVLIIADDPARLQVTLQLAERSTEAGIVISYGPEKDLRRHATREVQVRLHQDKFRAAVLRAYRDRCAICDLRHKRLLEGAHILPDKHPRGQPVVPNGLALCGLHHGAFDAYLLGIRPDLRIELRQDIREESDGPMLVHGLQGFHDKEIRVPSLAKHKPDPARLEERYELFRKKAS